MVYWSTVILKVDNDGYLADMIELIYGILVTVILTVITITFIIELT